jgi:selenocysteine lyase/cysteine desulfurase
MGNKYFNNAGAGIMSETTLDCVINHMKLEMSIGAYKAANVRNDEVMEFYSYAARLINAKSKNEIAYIDSASRGWNLVMYGLNVGKDDVIVTLETEYGTNLLTIYDIANKTGCKVRIVKCNKDGNVNIKDVETALVQGGTILAISHVAAQGSIVNPVVELGQIAKQCDVTYIVDGCQAVGQIRVDVQKINCHAYITAGRKWLCGPRGTGILYVRSDAPIRTPQIDLASSDLVFSDGCDVIGIKIRKDAKQFELWEKSIANLLGLKNAIKEYLNYGIGKVENQIALKSKDIRDSISENNNLVLVGDRDSLTGTVGFYMKNPMYEQRVKELFENNGFIISCMCDWDCPLSFPKNGVKYIFRITPHYYTDIEDIDGICNLIKHL